MPRRAPTQTTAILAAVAMPWGSVYYNPAMPQRFYVPGLAGLDVPVELPGDKVRHMRPVLRLGAGDMVSVFN